MVAVCAAVFAFSPNHLTAQSDADSAAVTAAAIQELQDQEATMADNQKQIDTKLAAISESLRQARIFVARGGR